MSGGNQGYLTARSEDYHIDSDGEVSYTMKKSDSADNVPVSVSEEDEIPMESEDEEKDSKAAPAPTIEGEEPCVSPPVVEEDIDDEVDNDDDNDEEDDDDEDGDVDDDDDDDNDDDDDDNNDEEEMSEYEVLRLRKIRMNNAKLASLGLLGGMTSNATPSADRTNRKKRVKRVATQGDFVRRVQPNAMYLNQHLTRILMTLSSARECVPSILQKQERRILSARGWTKTRRAVSLTHTFCRCLCFQYLILNPSTPVNADRLHLDDR
jgi:hypothetical protein